VVATVTENEQRWETANDTIANPCAATKFADLNQLVHRLDLLLVGADVQHA